MAAVWKGLPWWATLGLDIDWSYEEKWTRGIIFVIGSIINLIPFFVLDYFLKALIDRHNAALISAIICLPPSIWLGRRICLFTWPDFVRRADENAEKRLQREIN
jgi:hypothetical protein